MTTRIPTTGRKLAAAVALLTATTLLGTACTAQPPPSSASASGSAAETASAGPSETPSATPAPTPTASYKPADAKGRAQNVPVPVMPAAAKAKTKEGLEAFARYWFELLSYGYETGDTSRLVAITSAGCESCAHAKKVITGWHSGGRWLVGGRVTTPAISTTFRIARDGNYQVAMQVSQEGISYYNPDGKLSSKDAKPEDSGNLMLAVFRNGSWYVNNIQPIVG